MTAKEGCSNWKAWHDSEPGGEPTLHVIGECHFEDSGYSVELKPQEPQGINPTIYILQKVVHKPSHVSHHQQNIPVRYQEKTRAKYVEVHILPDDVHIPVKEVWVGAGTEMVTGSAQVQVPVFLSGIVSKLGVDYCMDGATHMLQTIAGPVRLKATNEEVLTFLNRVSGSRLRVTVAGYPVWGAECGHLNVYHAAPSEEILAKLQVAM